MKPTDPDVQRALRLGKDRKSQAEMLGVSTRTVQRMARMYTPKHRAKAQATEPVPDEVHDAAGVPIEVGDWVRYPVKDTHILREAEVVEILPPIDHRQFRLRVRDDDFRISVLRRVELVKVMGFEELT